MSDQKVDLALAFLESQPAAAAAVLEQLPLEHVTEFLGDVPYAHAAAVLEKMLPRYSARIIAALDPGISAGFLSEMKINLVAAIIRHSSGNVNKKLLEFLPEKTKIACKLVLNYSEELVGAWMMANITTLPNDCTAGEALGRLSVEQDFIDTDAIYVVDRERKLQGMVSIASLLRVDPSTSILLIMKKRPQAISGNTALISAANHAVWRKMDTVAIINRNRRIVGILRHVDMRKGLDAMSTKISKPSSSAPITGIGDVYKDCLFALFNSVGESISVKKK